jgi:rhamnosyltransferase subunit B
MNVLLVALGSAGDVYPLVRLGLALRERGHHVSLLANGYFEPISRRVGLAFHEIAPAADYHAVIEKPELWEPMSGFKLVMEWLALRPMRRTFAVIREQAIPGETVVVAPMTALGARIAQEHLKIPLVTICVQPSILQSSSEPPIVRPLPVSSKMPRLWNKAWLWLANRAVMDPLVRAETDAFRAELNLAPVRRDFAMWSLSPLRIVGLFPEWYAALQPDWPQQVRLTDFPLYDEGETVPLPEEAADFLKAGNPPIVFTPGSAMRQGRVFFEAAVDACRRLSARAVFVTKYQDQVPAGLPSTIRSFTALPFSRLFARASLVVHHGGIGTASQALNAGVPQLIIPMAFDQHDNASRLERLGVARSLSPRRFSGSAAARTIAELLNSHGVAECCRRAADRLRPTGSFEESCRLIEKAASDRERGCLITEAESCAGCNDGGGHEVK